MPVPSSLADLSTTAASNSPAGTDAIGTSLDDYLRTTQALLKQSVARGTDIASSSSITIPTNGSYCVVTGTTTINSIADSWNGREVTLKFSGSLTLTNSASLVLPGGKNIITFAGDSVKIVNESTGVWRCVSVNRGYGNGIISVKDFGAVGDGVTDDTAAIQAALNAGAGKKVVFNSGYTFVTSGNEVSSDSYLLFEAGCVLKLKNGANRPALQNVNFSKTVWGGSTYGLDQNITIDGLYLDGNEANQDKYSTVYSGELVVGIRFGGVQNLTIKNTTIYRAKNYHIWVYAVKFLDANNIRFEAYSGTISNQDGFHVNGPAQYLDIRNVKGFTNDDIIALTADDVVLGSNATNAGAITDAVIDGVYCDGCLNGVRLLSATSFLDKVVVSNVVGTTRDLAVNVTPYGLGDGYFGSITIQNIDVVCGPLYQSYLSEYFSIVTLGGIIANATVKNVYWRQTLDNRPAVLVALDANIKNLVIDTVTGLLTTPIADLSLIKVRANRIDNFIINNVTWSKPNSADIDGSVLKLELPTDGRSIDSLICNNWITYRCGDLITQTGGQLNALMVRNVLDRQGASGSRVALLASAHTSPTVVDIRSCHVDSGKVLVTVANGSSILNNSFIEPASTAVVEAKASVNQSVSGSAWTQIVFDSEEVDTSDSYNTSTSTFTCNTAPGYYNVGWNIRVNVPTAGTTIDVAIYINGTRLRYVGGGIVNASAGDYVLNGTTRVGMALNGQLTVRVYPTNAITVLAADGGTNFSVAKA